MHVPVRPMLLPLQVVLMRGEPEQIRALVNNSSEGGDRPRGFPIREVPGKIVSVVLDDDPDFAPGIPVGTKSVLATFDNRVVRGLFSYYTDELTFTPDEFIGLTEDEARELFRVRDLEYLRS